MNSKNAKEAQPAEMVLDVDEFREEAGIVALEAQVEELQRTVNSLQKSVGEWLVYLNEVDRRVQGLGGEPQVTETITYNARPDGDVELRSHRPPIPASLLSSSPGPVKRVKKS